MLPQEVDHWLVGHPGCPSFYNAQWITRSGADFRLKPGQVAYITTGAPIPAGADAVIEVTATALYMSAVGAVKHMLRLMFDMVQVEATAGVQGQPQKVQINARATIGQHIRPSGSDIAAGEKVQCAHRCSL